MKVISHILLVVIISIFLQSCGNPLAVIVNDNYARTISNDKHKTRIDIPEIYEMMMVVAALTEIEQSNNLLVDTTTAYYQEVKTHFTPYDNHALVKRLNKGFRKRFWRIYSVSTINRQGVMYDFNKEKLRYLNHYKMRWAMRSLPTPLLIFKKNKSKIEDFYQKTQFAAFYQKHQSYYDLLIEKTKTIVELDDIWQWLEDNFPNRKQAYRVVTSPLLGGIHNTVPFATKNKTWSEMVCFVSPVTLNNITQLAEFKFNQQRMYVSEISENYAHVPPQYIPYVEKAMNKNMLKWNSGNAVARKYKGAERTFNENFTHAVMACYGFDRYEPAVFEKKWTEWQDFMVKKRGFPMFKEFSNELLRLYKNRQKGQKVCDLFAPMVEWVQRNE